HYYENRILYGKDNYEISRNGDSGGPVFYYLQSLLSVGLVGIHTYAVADYSSALPLSVILRE
ncbi:8918_t:CDS:1, partial [Racocetra persica]